MGRNLSPLPRKELANLDKDSDSRKSAMKALKSYVKGLDSKAIPQFLAQVSETRLGLCPVIVTVSRWMPLAVYWGKLGMHFWTAVAFAYLFTVLECIRCALAGMYADVPFACDAAYIQIPND